MGRPKQLLHAGGKSILARLVETLEPWAAEVVLLGQGPLPGDLPPLEVFEDPPGPAGPLAGLLGGMRKRPGSSWILVGCDMPHVTGEALSWLLSHAGPSIPAVLPILPGSSRPEPLLAWYGPSLRPRVEEQVRRGRMALRKLSSFPGVLTPKVPEELAISWKNINTPGELSDETSLYFP